MVLTLSSVAEHKTRIRILIQTGPKFRISNNVFRSTALGAGMIPTADLFSFLVLVEGVIGQDGLLGGAELVQLGNHSPTARVNQLQVTLV